MPSSAAAADPHFESAEPTVRTSLVMSSSSSHTVQASVNPSDERTMREILTRDQRTTYHRVRSCSDERQADFSSSLIVANSVVMTAASSKKSSSTTTRCSGDDRHDDCAGCSKSRTRDLVVTDEIARTMYSSNNVNSTVTISCDDNEELRKDSERCCATAPPSYQIQDLGIRRAKFVVACGAWLRLGSLLVALLAISVQSAPVSMDDRRMQSVPKWTNPCGFAAEEFEGDIDVMQLNDDTLLNNIVMQAKTALNYAHDYRDAYIKRTFNTDYADLHLTWKDNHYDWLPGPKQIPKELGQQLDKEFLDKLEVRMLDTALVDTYEYLQRYAVGLEQIAWDQEDHGLEFRKQFKDSEYHLRAVLCELQMALAERGVTPRPDVSRDIMSREYRDMSVSATYRNLRDWLIFRDYMNGLEYVIQMFGQFLDDIRSSNAS